MLHPAPHLETSSVPRNGTAAPWGGVDSRNALENGQLVRAVCACIDREPQLRCFLVTPKDVGKRCKTCEVPYKKLKEKKKC